MAHDNDNISFYKTNIFPERRLCHNILKQKRNNINIYLQATNFIRINMDRNLNLCNFLEQNNVAHCLLIYEICIL